MKEIYVVTSGEYSDYGIVKIFENIEDAEHFCAIHNDDIKPYDDNYYLEIYPLSEYGGEEKIQTYKALSCQVIERSDSIPSTVKIICIETQFSKKPFNKSFKCVDSWIGACEYSSVIPVNKTYDIYEQREIVEKIIRDEFYKWKAEKEGYCVASMPVY